MNLHSSAKTCPYSRALLVLRVRRDGWPVQRAASSANISLRTAFKWLARFRAQGIAGLQDRSSRPRRSPSRTKAAVVAEVIGLRRQRLPATVVAQMLGQPRSTVGLILRRKGLARWSSLQKKVPAVRYELADPGGLLHLDTKRLGKIQGVGHRIHGNHSIRQRGIGYETVHVCIDACTRAAYVEVLPDEKKETTAAFLSRALLHYSQEGVKVQRILTDNGMCYHSNAVQEVCDAAEIKHTYTKPYRPQTNGKAERFIQTALREWAYRLAYQSSEERTQVLKAWLHYYNHHRAHSALGGLTPALMMNNVLGRDN